MSDVSVAGRAGTGLMKSAPGAAILALFAILGYATDDNPPAGITPLAHLLVIYVGAWLISGSLFGILYPLAQRKWTQALASIPVGVPAGFLLILMTKDWRISEVSTGDMLLACVLGGVGGLLVWGVLNAKR